jgi:mannose-1-phosphate guanylyltransferase
VVDTDEEGRVLAFIEKPPPGEAPTNLINAGIYVIEREVLERIPAGRRVSVERETFPLLAAEGSLFALADDAYWLDTGTPEAYLRAHRDLLDSMRGEPPTAGARRSAQGAWELGSPSISGSVDRRSVVADRAQVHAGASVTGSDLGVGCVVGSGARVAGSVLLSGSRVHEDATVDSSIIGHRAIVGAGCVVTSTSIIGDDLKLEAGTQLAGARLPEVAPMLP